MSNNDLTRIVEFDLEDIENIKNEVWYLSLSKIDESQKKSKRDIFLSEEMKATHFELVEWAKNHLAEHGKGRSLLVINIKAIINAMRPCPIRSANLDPIWTAMLLGKEKCR